MVVWDGDDEYFTVVGSESIDETNIGNQVSKFLEGYRAGNVIQKQLHGSMVGFINSHFGGKLAIILILVVLIMVLILMMTKEEHLTVGTQDHAADGTSSTSSAETRESRRDNVKED